jgi:hypothetical protein
LIDAKISGNVDCLPGWASAQPEWPISVHVPNESSRLFVDRISQGPKALCDFFGWNVNSLHFHRFPRTCLNPLIALERAPKRLMAHVDGLLGTNKPVQTGVRRCTQRRKLFQRDADNINGANQT